MPVLYLCWHFCDENICPKLIKYPRKRAWMTDTHERARASEGGRCRFVERDNFSSRDFLRETRRASFTKLQIANWKAHQTISDYFFRLSFSLYDARSLGSRWLGRLEGGRERGGSERCQPNQRTQRPVVARIAAARAPPRSRAACSRCWLYPKPAAAGMVSSLLSIQSDIMQ